MNKSDHPTAVDPKCDHAGCLTNGGQRYCKACHELEHPGVCFTCKGRKVIMNGADQSVTPCPDCPPATAEPAESEGKEIDRWAIGQALNDLHFQKDSVRKCAAVNDLLERAERQQFRQSKRAESEGKE